MRACLRGASILAVIFLVLPLLAAQDTKDAKKPAAPAADKAPPEAKPAPKKRASR